MLCKTNKNTARVATATDTRAEAVRAAALHTRPKAGGDPQPTYLVVANGRVPPRMHSNAIIANGRVCPLATDFGITSAGWPTAGVWDAGPPCLVAHAPSRVAGPVPPCTHAGPLRCTPPHSANPAACPACRTPSCEKALPPRVHSSPMADHVGSKGEGSKSQVCPLNLQQTLHPFSPTAECAR